MLFVRLTDVMQRLGDFGFVLNFVGWFVLFSNLALLVAWALSPRGRRVS